MKQNLRDEALSAVLPKIREIFPDAVDVCVSNKNMIAVPTGKVDENGQVVYATIDVTIKDNEATKTREGFSLETAVAAYEEKASKATERKSKTASTPKNTEASERKNKRMATLREWWTNEAISGEGYTSTMVKTELADVYAELTIMQVGSDLKTLSEIIPTECEMRVVEGKKHYYKA